MQVAVVVWVHLWKEGKKEASIVPQRQVRVVILIQVGVEGEEEARVVPNRPERAKATQ